MTEEQFTQFFWLVFEALPDEKVRSTLKEYWKTKGKDCPYIWTKAEHYESLFGEINYAANKNVTMAFNLSNIADRKHSVIEIIYHEIAHCFHNNRDGILFSDYHSSAFTKIECEKEAIRLSRRWCSILRHKPKMRRPLEENPLVGIAANQFDVSPLEIKN